MSRRPSSARAARLAALCLATLAAAGCGDEEDAKSGDALGEGDAALTVTLDPDGPAGEAKSMTQDLDCEDASTDAPCLAARDLQASDLAPPPADQACTELFGGPDVATIEGRLNG